MLNLAARSAAIVPLSAKNRWGAHMCPPPLAVRGLKGLSTLFKVVFHTEIVCQKIQHVPLAMLVTFFQKILRRLQEINALTFN